MGADYAVNQRMRFGKGEFEMTGAIAPVSMGTQNWVPVLSAKTNLFQPRCVIPMRLSHFGKHSILLFGH